MAFGITSDYITGTGLNLTNTSSSISLWINKQYAGDGSNGVWIMRVGDQSANGQSMHLATDYGQSLRYSFFGDDFDLQNHALQMGSWYNIVATYNVTNNQRAIYIDAQPIATDTASYGFSGDTYFALGFQDVDLDDMRFCNRALNQSDVTALYTLPAPEPNSLLLAFAALTVLSSKRFRQ